MSRRSTRIRSRHHIDGRNEATTIINYHDCRRPASVLTLTNTNYRSSRHHCSTNNNDNIVTPANTNYTTPNINISSIRYRAHIDPVSTGLQSDRRYNLNNDEK